MPNPGPHAHGFPEPETVWLVRPGSPEAIPGRLSLESGTLRFAAEDITIEIRDNEIRRARRRRGTPILEVLYGDDQTLFLYFSEPPPLPGITGPEARFGRRGIVRAASAMKLRAEAKLLRQKIDEWVEALRETK